MSFVTKNTQEGNKTLELPGRFMGNASTVKKERGERYSLGNASAAELENIIDGSTEIIAN